MNASRVITTTGEQGRLVDQRPVLVRGTLILQAEGLHRQQPGVVYKNWAPLEQEARQQVNDSLLVAHFS